MGSDGNGESFLRQLGVGGGGSGWDSSCYYSNSTRGSRRWGKSNAGGGGDGGWEVDQMGVKKRVIVVIDHGARAKHAMMWALTHVATKGDVLTLLHVLSGGGGGAPNLANSLGSLCKACKPEVEVEALVVQGPKLATILSQVRKLEASVLVLSQGNPSPLCCLFRSSGEELVEQCINKADCLTLAVRKQSKGVGGYLVSSRWHKNFWLLA